jgi:hypothetical protein
MDTQRQLINTSESLLGKQLSSEERQAVQLAADYHELRSIGNGSEIPAPETVANLRPLNEHHGLDIGTYPEPNTPSML